MTQIVKIAIARPDGGVSIMSFIVRGRGSSLPEGQADWEIDGDKQRTGWWLRLPSQENIEIEVRKSVPDALRWHRVVDEQIPVDRTFRDALHHDGKGFVHRIDKARDIARDLIRHARANQFVTLDAEFMRALGTGKGGAEVEKKRQALRDAPADPRIDAAKTIDDLKPLLP